MREEAIADFGQLLREHRMAAGLTQEALAERAGLGVRSIQALERGESKPLQDTLQRLTTSLALTPEQRLHFATAAGPLPRRRTLAAPIGHGRPVPEQSLTWNGRPGSLPVPLTSFVGREQELADLAHLLQRARLLTLTGPGGTGKTRLALQVAVAARPRFRDGVVYVPLAAITDSSLVAVAIAGAFGVQQGDEPSLVNAALAVLQTKQLLLVLDNFEQVAAAAPLVGSLLAACPAVRVLVTSRSPLHLSGEQEYQVPPLGVPTDDSWHAADVAHLAQWPAVALFVQRAQLVRPDFALSAENASMVGQICRRLDGLPLAIELAAARVRSLAPATLLARLDQCLQLLRGGAQDLPERQQTLRAAMAWSYDLLTPTEQILFQRLAVFCGGWSLEAAEAVCVGHDLDGQVLDTLDLLVDKSLVVVESEGAHDLRYSMLETIRAFALERLEAGGSAPELRRRHAEYYRQFAERAAPEPGAWMNSVWMDWTEREQDNLRAAQQWAHDHEEVELEMRLMIPLIGLWYWHRQLRDGQEQLETLLGLQERYRHLLPPDLHVHALTALAKTLWQRGEYDRAEALVEECLAQCCTPSLEPYIRSALHYQALITCERGKYEEATALYQEYLSRSHEAGDTLAMARAVLGLSDVARGLGDAGQIIARCEECRELNRETGDQDLEGYMLHNLGLAAWLQHDLPGAEKLLAESLALFRRLRPPSGVQAEMLTSVGRVASAQGHLEQARSAFEESLALARPCGPFVLIPGNLDELASLAFLQQQAAPAVQVFSLAQALREASGLLPGAMRWVRHDRDIAAARAQLGEADFARAWRAGRALTLDEATTIALQASRIADRAG